jgi:hypothetical protein
MANSSLRFHWDYSCKFVYWAERQLLLSNLLSIAYTFKYIHGAQVTLHSERDFRKIISPSLLTGQVFCQYIRVASWFVFKPKFQFGSILEGLRLENVYTFHVHLEYSLDIWDIVWPFGAFCINLVHFFRFWYNVARKIWQPCGTYKRKAQICICIPRSRADILLFL